MGPIDPRFRTDRVVQRPGPSGRAFPGLRSTAVRGALVPPPSILRGSGIGRWSLLRCPPVWRPRRWTSAPPGPSRSHRARPRQDHRHQPAQHSIAPTQREARGFIGPRIGLLRPDETTRRTPPRPPVRGRHTSGLRLAVVTRAVSDAAVRRPQPRVRTRAAPAQAPTVTDEDTSSRRPPLYKPPKAPSCRARRESAGQAGPIGRSGSAGPGLLPCEDCAGQQAAPSTTADTAPAVRGRRMVGRSREARSAKPSSTRIR